MQRIGVLTGGGDSSGINALLRSIVVEASANNWEVLGVMEGWKGLIEGRMEQLTLENTRTISTTAGTVLGTSRTNPFKLDGAVHKIKQNLQLNTLDGLIAIGGDDTLGVAARLAEDGLPVIGIPQTVDNDIFGTDYCVGFDTAVNQAVQVIDAARPSNDSHRKDMIVEAMGRENGWIALYTALAAQADYLVIPEHPLDMEHLIDSLKANKEHGKLSSLIVIAEGIELPDYDRGEAVDAFGNKSLEGVSRRLAAQLTELTGWQFRVQILGFMQRGGRPTVYEMRNSIEMGQFAVDLLKGKKTNVMVARVKDELHDIKLGEVIGNKTLVPERILQIARRYGCFGRVN